jgi:hypothetical protein
VEIYEACIGLPPFDRSDHSTIIESTRPAEPLGQSFLRADIITGKDVNAAEASQEHIFCRPASDAAQREQPLSHDTVISRGNVLEIQAPFHNQASKLEERARFLSAEADFAALLSRQARHVERRGKRRSRASRPAMPYQSVRSIRSPSSLSRASVTRRLSATVRTDGVAVTAKCGCDADPRCRTSTSIGRRPTTITRRYV